MATSGHLETAYLKNSAFYVDWQIARQDVSGNYTVLNWQAGLYTSNSDKWYSNAIKINYINIQDTLVHTDTTYSNITTNGFHQLASGQTTIYHNDDGSKRFFIDISGWLYTYGDTRGTAEWDLEPIPRTSKLSLSNSSVILGNAITINTNRASSSFTHNLYWQSSNGNWNTIATGVEDNYKWTVPVSLASEFPSNTSGIRNIICETYNNGTYIGSSTAQLEFNVPSSIVPSISNMTVSDPTSRNVYIETLSNVRVQTTAGGSYGSSISSCVVTLSIDGSVKKTLYGTDVTFDLNNLNMGSIDKTVTLKTTVTDSRGRQASTSKNITVYWYFKPYIGTTKSFRCNSSGVADDDGTYISIYWTYGVRSISGNATYPTVRYRRQGTSTWTNVSLGNGETKIIGDGNISVDYSYEVQYIIGDNFYSNISYTSEISTGYTTMDFKAGGKGIAFGKVANQDGFECDMNTTFNKKVEGNAEITWNASYNSNADYNDYQKSGIYYMTTGCTNAPEGIAYCRLLVLGASGSNDITQIACTINKYARMFMRCMNTGTWQGWREIPVNVTDNDGQNVDYINATEFRYTYDNTRTPSGHNGYIVTHKASNNYLIQEFIDYLGYYRFRRAKLNGVWQPWQCTDRQEVFLYNNSSGSNGTINLSENIKNFNRIIILYKNDDYSYCASEMVCSPVNKVVNLQTSHVFTPSSNTTVIDSRRIYITEAQIITDTASESYGRWWSHTNNTEQVNKISIYAVIGYR